MASTIVSVLLALVTDAVLLEDMDVPFVIVLDSLHIGLYASENSL